ncbi:uncharacterized protein [Eurosta solidaginis]|uniref:uncharacterized protein n=1 Tax=Eurosta solidaginis TaxID=178769 RepID=UPI003530DA8B
MFEIDLIDSVRRYPCLYDPNMDRTRLIVDMAWKNVSREIKVDVQMCRNRWKSMRDKFIRHYKNPDLDHISPWPLMEHMLFLKDYIAIPIPNKAREENVSQNEISSCTKDTQDEMDCIDDKNISQELSFVYDDGQAEQDFDIEKQEYSLQTPEPHETISYFKSDNEGNDEATTTRKKRFKESSEKNARATFNYSKKKRQLFQEYSPNKYDTLIGTMNEYIRNRIKEDEEQKGNDDFFKVLDTYLKKLPETAQDELMAKILLKVLNKNNSN